MVRKNLGLSSANHRLDVHFFVRSPDVTIASLADSENFLDIVFVHQGLFDFARVPVVFRRLLVIVVIHLLPFERILVLLLILLRGNWFLGMMPILARPWSPTHHLHLILEVVRSLPSVGGQVFVLVRLLAEHSETLSVLRHFFRSVLGAP